MDGDRHCRSIKICKTFFKIIDAQLSFKAMVRTVRKIILICSKESLSSVLGNNETGCLGKVQNFNNWSILIAIRTNYFNYGVNLFDSKSPFTNIYKVSVCKTSIISVLL